MISTFPPSATSDHRGSGRLDPKSCFDAGCRDAQNSQINWGLRLRNRQYAQGCKTYETQLLASLGEPQLHWSEAFQVTSQLDD